MCQTWAEKLDKRKIKAVSHPKPTKTKRVMAMETTTSEKVEEEVKPSQTLYINNINERVKKDGSCI
jgi:hypothetical protein